MILVQEKVVFDGDGGFHGIYWKDIWYVNIPDMADNVNIEESQAVWDWLKTRQDEDVVYRSIRVSGEIRETIITTEKVRKEFSDIHEVVVQS